MKVSPAPSPGKSRKTALPPEWQLLVDQRQGSAMLNVSLPTFRSWEAAGRFSAVELPFGIRRKLYRRSDLEAFVASLEDGGADCSSKD